MTILEKIKLENISYEKETEFFQKFCKKHRIITDDDPIGCKSCPVFKNNFNRVSVCNCKSVWLQLDSKNMKK